MDDLVTWLRAQLDEIETDARFYLDSGADNGPGMEWAQLALAEVDAKRRILDFFERQTQDNGWFFADAVIGALALPYADRPGYRDEWKP